MNTTFNPSDNLRHELARRGFFTCSAVIQAPGLTWTCEDWTDRKRTITLRSDGKIEVWQRPLKSVVWAVNSEESFLSDIDALGWKPLDDSPVPEWYFPKPKAA